LNRILSSLRRQGSSFCHPCVVPAFAGREPEHRFMKTYYVYILASKKNGTLYVGVTSNLSKRIFEHKQDLVDGFTKKYGVHSLVYIEQTNDVNDALLRERRLKAWKRQWKIDLIEKSNPNWNDLYEDLF